MAITEQQVIKAAERIAERGERPTNPRIRAELGEGSYSTINKYMAAWRAAQQEPEAPEPEPEAPQAPEVPETIMAQAQQLAGQLVTAAWRESDAKHAEAVEAERHALQSEFDKLRAERAGHDAEIQELNDALARLEQQGEEAVAQEQAQTEGVRQELEAVRRQHADTREELAAVAATGKASRERVEELREELEAVRRQAVQADEQARQQAAEAAQQASAQVDEIARLRRELEAAQAATAQAEQAAQKATEAAQAAEDQAERERATRSEAEREAREQCQRDLSALEHRAVAAEARLEEAQASARRFDALLADLGGDNSERGPGSEDDQPSLPFDRG